MSKTRLAAMIVTTSLLSAVTAVVLTSAGPAHAEGAVVPPKCQAFKISMKTTEQIETWMLEQRNAGHTDFAMVNDGVFLCSW